MNKTLYISDLDGTLLNSKSVVAPATSALLNRMIAERGILFSVATARTPATVVNLLSEVKSPLPFIVMTGAAMWKQGEVLVNRHYMQAERLDFLLECCRENGIRPFIYTYNEQERRIDAYHSPEMSQYERDFAAVRTGSPFKQFIFTNHIPDEARQRAMLLFAAENFDSMGAAYRKAHDQLPCSMTYYRDIFDPSVGFLEVMAEGVSKAAAVEQLAAQSGANRIVVFGDSPNDLSMREVADLFVAPENASEQVIAVADEVIGSNDANSVALRIARDLPSFTF